MTRRRHNVIAAAAGLLYLLLMTPAVAVSPPGGPQTRFTTPHVAAQILVKPAPGIVPDAITSVLLPFGGAIVDFAAAGNLYVVEITNDSDLATAITALEADPRFEFAEPNYLYDALATPNDLSFAQQWSKDNTGVNAPNGLGTPGADMNMVSAWNSRTTAPGVIIAIIDDSVETTHVDLVANILPTGKCFASAGSSRPCTNGPNDPNPADNNDFHGTLVAGSAAARGNNGIGIAGVAWETGILPLKVDLSSFAIVNAIDEAIAQGADIINMSFGGPVQGAAQGEALSRAELAGILAVAAAGNADANNDIASHFPSDSNHRNVVSVAATDSQDEITGFSQWAPFSVDLAAPGDRILSTAINNSYATASGTSFSSPHIAGVAALVKAETAAADYKEIKAHLLHGTTNGVSTLGPVVPGQSKLAVPGRVATGRIDANAALSGPTGGVLLISGISVNDNAGGNANGVLEPGETALLNISVENIWSAESSVTGSLSTPNTSLLMVNDFAPVFFGNIARDGSATASFSVTLSNSVTGNEQIFMQLDLGSTASPSLPSRYFYLETGTLTNGNAVTQQIQRWDWDEFQAFTIDVPVGATQLNIATTGPGDIDLLVRHQRSPEYLINLGGGSFYYTDSDTRISSGAGSNESVAIANPLPGVYHVVVVNYDQTSKTYQLTGSYVPANSGSVRYSAATFTQTENGGNALITVTRTGGSGAASVTYSTSAGTATAQSDYADVVGTLNWGVAENGDKTFSVPIVDDLNAESTETVILNLSNPVGAVLSSPSSATLEIVDDDSLGGTVSFTAAQYSVNEAAGNVQVGITRSGGSLGAVSVDFATAPGTATAGSDYTDSSTTISWGDGETGTQTVLIPIIADATQENTESFTLILSNPQVAILGSPSTATVAIADDDTAPATGGGGGGGGSLGLLFLLIPGGLLLMRHWRIHH